MGNSHHRKATMYLLTLVAAALSTPTIARAVIVRGTVTTPFGVPLGNARVQLIQAQNVAAYGFTQQDGTYGIQLQLRPVRAPHLRRPLHPQRRPGLLRRPTAVITRNIVMQYTTVSSDQTVIATGIPTPIQQLPTVVTLIPQSALATQIGIVNDLRQATGINVVQAGQAGGTVALYIRGGSPDANKVLTDSVPSTDIGGDFNYGPVPPPPSPAPNSTVAPTAPSTAPAPKRAQ